MKRLVSSALILLLLLALSVPALAMARPATWEEEKQYFGFTFDEDIQSSDIYEPWILDMTGFGAGTEEYDSYCVFANDTVFTFTNKAPAGGDNYMIVNLNYYADLAPNRYVPGGHGFELGLDSAGGISKVDELYVDGALPYMHIMPGQSFSITGADLLAADVGLFEEDKNTDKYMIAMRVEHRYPNADDTYSYWSIQPNLKHDEAKVAELRAAASAKPSFSDVASSDYFCESVNWAVANGVTNGTSDTTFSPAKTCTQEQIITFLYRAMSSPAVSAASPYSDVKDDAYYYDSARWAYEKGLRTGSAFGVGSPCTRSDVVLYLWMLAGKPAMSASGTFADVSPNAAYAQAVTWAVENGVTNGTSDTTFSPDKTCTRGQIVTFLFRALVK